MSDSWFIVLNIPKDQIQEHVVSHGTIAPKVDTIVVSVLPPTLQQIVVQDTYMLSPTILPTDATDKLDYIRYLSTPRSSLSMHPLWLAMLVHHLG